MVSYATQVEASRWAQLSSMPIPLSLLSPRELAVTPDLVECKECNELARSSPDSWSLLLALSVAAFADFLTLIDVVADAAELNGFRGAGSPWTLALRGPVAPGKVGRTRRSGARIHGERCERKNGSLEYCPTVNSARRFDLRMRKICRSKCL